MDDAYIHRYIHPFAYTKHIYHHLRRYINYMHASIGTWEVPEEQ